jgi:hypothetical protein
MMDGVEIQWVWGRARQERSSVGTVVLSVDCRLDLASVSKQFSLQYYCLDVTFLRFWCICIYIDIVTQHVEPQSAYYSLLQYLINRHHGISRNPRDVARYEW